MVAEVTGRTKRLINLPGGGQKLESRSARTTQADSAAFMEGSKRIHVFSDAGGTGRSYHASLDARNQQQRAHLLLEPGWRADRAIQGLGRTHRTHQACSPLFRPVTTDCKGELRFTSTIARRLDSLGALTRGQRQTGGQNLFDPADNLESEYAKAALVSWYHLLVAEGGTGWDHAVVMARSRDLLGPYDVHPDGPVLTAAGRREGPITRAGHGDLVELKDGSPWLAYLCGRPVPGKERCILGRETAIQPMRWHDDGWLRTLDGDARPVETPQAPDLPSIPWPQDDWDGRFDRDFLPLEFQWLRTPLPERLFSLSERPGFLRLYGRETVGSHFEQALVARRLEHRRFTATTCVDFSPRCFQQAAGLILYYNSTKYYYLNISVEGEARELQLMIASPLLAEGVTMETVGRLPNGPIELRADVDGDVLIFSWRAE
ncbi:hypothetical protein LTR94_026893, partial [Friedmanniomyces endolithicus]